MATEKNFKIKNGLQLSGQGNSLTMQDGDTLKHNTPNGYITFGPGNGSYAHIQTDRSKFYFNKQLVVDSGNITSYNEDLKLSRAMTDGQHLTIGTSAATFAGNLVVTGNLTVNGSTVTNSSTNTTIEDALIELGSGNTGTNSNDLGLILERGSTGDNVFIGWDESEDKIAFGTTTATGASTGNISYSRASILANALDLTNHIDIADSGKIRLGNSDDLQIYHDGSNSYIWENGTGNLILRATDFRLQDSSGNSMAVANSGGGVGLYHNASIKLDTTSTGIEVTGSTVTDGITLTGTGTDNDSYQINFVNGACSIARDNNDLELHAYNAMVFGVSNTSYPTSTERMRIDSSGRVGIGTTSPGQPLDVAGIIQSKATNPQVRINTSSGTGAGYLVYGDSGDDDRGWIAYLHDSDALQFRVNASVAMTIDSSQRLGLGTGSPEEKLEVAGNIRMQSPISTTTARPAATVATLNSGEIRAKNSDGSDGGLLRLSAGAGTTQNTMSYIDLQGYSTAETNNGRHIIFGTGGADRMEITESGNVGIGTATPSEKLSIAPDTDVSAEIGRAHIGAVGHSDYAAFSHVDKNTTGNFALMQHGSGETYLNASSGQKINFRINNSAKAILTGTGFGIGTTAPTTALEVIGDIKIKQGSGYSNYSLIDASEALLTLETYSVNTSSYAADIIFKPAGTERVRITDDGRVGILTNAPKGSLEIDNTNTVSDGDGTADEGMTGGDSIILHGHGGSLEQNYGSIVWTNGGSRRRAMICSVAENADTDHVGLAFYTQGTDGSGDFAESMRIARSGKVGIGTGSPSQQLHVAGNIYAASGFVNSSGYQLNGTYVVDSSRNLVNIGTISSGNITSSGTISASTATFSTALDASLTVQSTDSTTGIVFTDNNGTGHIYYIGSQDRFYTDGKFGVNGSTIASGMEFQVNGDATIVGELHIPTVLVHIGDTDTTAGFHGNDLFRIVTGGTERFEVSNSGIIINDGSVDYDLRVESNGNANMLFVDGGNDRVGIGTGSPAETLEVNGTMKLGNMKFQNATGGRLGFNRNTSTGDIYDSSYGAYQLQNNQASYMELQVYNSSGGHVTSHTFNVNGNVGIGTTSASARLHVAGDLLTTGGATIGDGNADALTFTGVLKQGLSGGTQVMDASRNMSNIGTISSGAITSTGDSEFETANSQHTGSTVNETLWEITDWDTTESLRKKLNTTSSNFTKVDDDTAPAGGVFQVVSNNNVYPNKFYPISDETYIIFEAWVKHESGSDTTGNFYAGSTFYNGSKSSFGNVNRYWGAGGDSQDSADGTNWRHIRGVLNGEALRNLSNTIDAEYMKLLFLFNYNASGNTTRYCGVRFYHSRKAVTHLLHVTSSQGDRNFRTTYDDISSAAVVLDGSRNLLNLESITLADSKELKLGSGDDLKIYHNGTHSYIDDAGTGKLILRGNTDVEIHKYTGEYMITANADGAVTLYYDDSAKLATINTGVNVTGAIQLNGTNFAYENGTGAYHQITDPTGNTALYLGGSDPGNYHNNTTHYFRDRSGTNFAFINANGFYLSQGTYRVGTTTVIDASRNLTNIGTYSGSGNISITGASSPKITLTDTTNSCNLLMYAQDSNSHIGTYSNHILVFDTNSTTALTLDTSQNATFAGTISSGAITTSGAITAGAAAIRNSGEGHPIGHEKKTEYYYDEIVGDADGSDNKFTLKDSAGNALTATTINKVYRVRLVTLGTGTHTGAVYIADNVNGDNITNGNWRVNAVNVHSNPTESSNYPLLELDSNVPKVSIQHNSNYTVRIFVEEFDVGNRNGHHGIFGTDHMLTAQYASKYLGVNRQTPLYTLDVGGSIGINGTGIVSSDRNLTNIQAITSAGTHQITSVSTSFNPFLVRYNSTYSNNNLARIRQDGAASIFNLYDSSGTAQVQFGTNTNNYLVAGNTGIGTNNPTSKLHLQDGDFRITGAFPRIYLQDSGHDPDYSIFNGNGKLRFYDDTNTADRLAIDSSGRVGIGTNAPGQKLDVLGIIRSNSTNPQVRIHTSSGTGTGYLVFGDSDDDDIGQIQYNHGDDSMRFQTAAAEDMRLTSGGDLHVDGDVIAFSGTISDERLKDDVVTIESALDKVMSLRGVEYIWNKGSKEGEKDLGVIAQEVEQVLPEIIKEKEMPFIDGETYKTVDYEKLTAVLIEAVKEQQKQINELKEHSHPAKDMCEFEGYHELMARIEKMEKNYGNN